MTHEEMLLEKLIDLAIAEDIADGDISSNAIIPQSEGAAATMVMKADGIISGMEVARRVFERFEAVTWTPYVSDGDSVKRGQVILRVEGGYRALLQAERLALNFLQRMSGIATMTARYAEALKGTAVRLLDTRKTAPGMRITDKMAVRHGGGHNHRMGLYDMIMLKDNHIKVAGGIPQAIEAARRALPLSIKLEVETSNLAEVEEAVRYGADIIMLDNMDNDTMCEAVRLIAGRARTEASGNMTLERLQSVAETGVDYISVGALTHSVTAMDISMNFLLTQ
ncbi:carboxylating nicotinate-nucleotide diphosphorylase [Porphyromonas gingivalis]|uniref:carboxylating nicotinate-nucleotide diphosphorylase n=1 Tax=Porphyromonas gingivalis TaxID=837 RepID=UPI000717B332|nr:carboxylating nicotinate-nucleotide diphosphorylase [Porphyromonas gingivalis]ALO29254.1 nicotinate-nucleotide pyrophosphorylase (carboxylating) [Porphyromonas gingivalis A7A1-28]SJL29982.1 nicotinate-nucleotide diphosphorylase (carboxylating) [Porphyromonas gingivalis]